MPEYHQSSDAGVSDRCARAQTDSVSSAGACGGQAEGTHVPLRVHEVQHPLESLASTERMQFSDINDADLGLVHFDLHTPQTHTDTLDKCTCAQ
jgi:hypothetical protein